VKRHLACAVGAALLTAVLAACSSGSSSTGGQPEQSAPAPAASEPADVANFLGRDDESGAMDCDAGDKAKKEIPDCGFYAGRDNATFYWWSWVEAGRTTPPAGWSAGREVAPYRPSSSTRRGRR
jgi:hypothetical protein